jgi:hypothetical protein
MDAPRRRPRGDYRDWIVVMALIWRDDEGSSQPNMNVFVWLLILFAALAAVGLAEFTKHWNGS